MHHRSFSPLLCDLLRRRNYVLKLIPRSFVSAFSKGLVTEQKRFSRKILLSLRIARISRVCLASDVHLCHSVFFRKVSFHRPIVHHSFCSILLCSILHKSLLYLKYPNLGQLQNGSLVNPKYFSNILRS